MLHNIRALIVILFSLFSLSLVFAHSGQIEELDLSYRQLCSQEKPLEQNNLWEQMIASFAMPFPHKSDEVDRQVHSLLQNRYHLIRSLKKMGPYLPFLLHEIQKEQLPAEVMIIPLIESCYHPSAQSRYGAKGLWQMMASTGQDLGLVSSQHFEPLFDITLSTKAALKHLKTLHCRFGSWVLALAAYNAGSSRLRQALNKVNFRHDMDFFKLDLPEETLSYVPKILAFCHLIEYSYTYDLPLPRTIDPLISIELGEDYDFTTLALALEKPVSSFAHLNKQYLDKALVFTEPKHFILPKSFLTTDLKSFQKRLAYLKKHPFYTICAGDTLISIAKRFGVSVLSLQQANILKDSTIYQGKCLKIPQTGLFKIAPIEYTVKPGDCLSFIAKKYQSTVADLQKMNDLRDTKVFIGQKLIIRRPQ